MAKFEQLNQYISSILSTLIQNQTICKLLEYPANNPFDEPEISDTSKLIFSRIFPIPKFPDVQTIAGSFLNVYFDSYRLSTDNRGTKEGIILFNIIVHNDLWRMQGTGMLRPYSILHEIDEMFNNQNVIGIKKAQFDRGKFLYINDKYSGYQVGYSIISVN